MGIRTSMLSTANAKVEMFGKEVMGIRMSQISTAKSKTEILCKEVMGIRMSLISTAKCNKEYHCSTLYKWPAAWQASPSWRAIQLPA